MAQVIPTSELSEYVKKHGKKIDYDDFFRQATKIDCPVVAGTVKDIAKPMRILYDRMEEMSICK